MNRKIVGIFLCMLLITATGFTVVGTIKKKDDFQRNEQSSNGLIEMWKQEPDLEEIGVNICCDQIGDIERVLANDFECTAWGFLAEIHLFGSWKDNFAAGIDQFNLTIYSDTPALESPTGYSMPNESLWTYEVTSFSEVFYGFTADSEMWWDPYTDDHYTDDEIWEYDITIPIDEAFLQKGSPDNPIIYWLAVHAIVNIDEGGRFGLRSAAPHKIDDTVMWNYSNPPYYWDDLYYPPGSGHPTDESIDFAFTIFCKELSDVIVIESPGLFDFPLVDLDLINAGNDTIPHLPYELVTKGTGGLIPTGNSSSSGVIENLEPGERITIKTEPVFGIGPFDIIVKVMGYEVRTFQSFAFLFFVINKIWLNPM